MPKIILIVDDDPKTLELFADAFLKEGFNKAMGAITGQEVASLIEEKKPDIVLLDVDIKGEDSLESLSKIKKVNRDLPVIMLADESNRNLAEKALKGGASSYVIKSSPIHEIVKDVKKEVDQYLALKSKKKTNILVVDDDKDIANIVKNFLEADGYSCLVVNDAKKALAVIKSCKPKLIFLDIVMSGIDGMELLQQIKDIDKKIKVVMMSGVADKDVSIAAVQKGAAGYIAKPFSMQQLRVTVASTLLE